MKRRGAIARGGWHALAVCAFAIAALWTSRAVLPDPTSVVTLLYPTRALWISDVRRNIAQTAYASRILSTDPADFFTGQMCFPTPDSVSFGEHMFGEGLLGIPARLLWDEPVLTFNFVVTVRPLIGAVAMYALAIHWTGSAAAAWIAGFLFGFHPMRLTDLAHPSVVGNEWIPAVLLSLHLLFTRRRWREAFLFTGLTALQLLESFYVVIQLALAIAVYGSYLIWRHRRELRPLLAKLAVAAAALIAVAATIFHPYLESRELWSILQGRAGFPLSTPLLGFGARYYLGSCLLVLAIFGLVDRVRGGSDPRLPMLAMAAVAMWFALPVPIPATGITVPSLLALWQPWLPGLDAVRAPGKVIFLGAVPLAFLGAYGVRAVVWRLGPAPRAVAVALIAFACIAEVFVPSVAQRSFGMAMPSSGIHVRPVDADLVAVRDLPPGPVLDLPLRYDDEGSLFMSRAVLIGAYHDRRQTACKGSFITPVQHEIAEMTESLPQPQAGQKLWALGVRSVVFYGQDHPKVRSRTEAIVEAMTAPGVEPRLEPVGRGLTVRTFRLVDGPPVSTDLKSLSPLIGERKSRAGHRVDLEFAVRGGEMAFRHPDPVQPSDVRVTWRRDGEAGRSTRVRALLPLALAPGEEGQVVVRDEAPARAGTYEVTLTTTGDTVGPMGIQRVLVAP